MTEPDSASHIAIYLHTIFNGGIERVLFALAEGMIKRKIRVDLVVNFTGFSPMLKEIPLNTNLVDLNCSSFHKRLPKLVRYIRTNRPDCILAAGHFANEIAILAKLFSGTGVRVIVSEHTSLSVELKSLPIMSPRRIAIPLVDPILYRFADAVIAVSDGVRHDCSKFLGHQKRKCRTIPNPVNTKRILQLGEEPLDDPWFAPEAPPVVLSIGRLEKQKDFITLIEAFAEARNHVEARLLILGEGSERQILAERIRKLGLTDHVLMPGFVTNPFPYLKHAAVFALSSEWEGLPTVLIEALAHGVPIVSTDCPSGPSEILASGKYGILVPTRDPKSLATGIVRLLKGDRNPVPDNALEPYALNSVLDQYLKVLRA
jgi:glycosyltransferase involved in cell wall biosynthesis